MTREARIRVDVRNALAGKVKAIRGNAGQGWTGEAEWQPDGSILLRNPRPLHALPMGFSGLFAWRAVTISPDMVGQKVAQFIAIDLKTDSGRATPEQLALVAAVQRDGGRAGIARNVEDAEGIALG